MEAGLLFVLCAIVGSSSTALGFNLDALAGKSPLELKRSQCTAGLEARGNPFPGLFRSPAELEVMRSGARVSCGRLTESNYAVLSFYGATCSKPAPSFLDVSAEVQDTCNYVTADRSSLIQPCCQTNFQVVQPLNVTSVFGQQFTVRHYSHSVQVAHIGVCSSLNTACSNGGRCTQEYRVDWVLVVGLPDSFIPVEMPNHCVCVFT